MQSDEVMPGAMKMEFADFDREFGAFLLRFSGTAHPEVAAAGMLVSYELRSGNPLLELEKYAGCTIETGNGAYITLPAVEEWRNILLQSGAAAADSGNKRIPLVFRTRSSVMLRRYAGYAESVEKQLFSRRIFEPELIFPQLGPGTLDPIQQLAVFIGLNSRLLILSGGPGTGKTTVCGHIIRELFRRDPERRILFAAPTGKAQQRLAAQIRESGSGLPEDSPVRKAIEAAKGATLHSFILNPEWRTELEHCDLMIIDECSMISLEIFSRILECLPPDASLILAGDRCQLTSIESGSVFADICSLGKVNQLQPEIAGFYNASGDMAADVAESRSGFSGYIVELQKNFRSAKAPEICRISAMLRERTLPDEAMADLISGTDTPDFRFRTAEDADVSGAIREMCCKWKELPQLCRSGDSEQILRALEIIDRSKILCAVNQGAFGTEAVNAAVLRELDIVPESPGKWLPGTVLLITANDKSTGLRNGDIGIVVMENLEDTAVPQCCVRFLSCPERAFLLAGLPEHECGFAISVHRAQGSGYPEVILLLPGYNAAVLSWELLYTGITRAAGTVEVLGSREELLFALENRSGRSSSLFEKRN